MDESIVVDNDDEYDRNCDNIEPVGDVAMMSVDDYVVLLVAAVAVDTDDYYCSKRFSVEMMKDVDDDIDDLLNDVFDCSNDFQQQPNDLLLHFSQ